jgi:hypothetical protein
LQVGADGGPFGGGDAVDTGVAEGAVGGEDVGAEDAVEFGAEAFDGAAALLIHEVGAELDGDAGEGVEGVGEEEELGLGVEGGALDAAGVPGGADLEAAVEGVDVHVGGHADGLAGGAVEDGEGEHGAGGVEGEAAGDLLLHGVGGGDAGVPELPEVAVAGGVGEAGEVVGVERDEGDVVAFEGDGLEEVCGHRSQYRVAVFGRNGEDLRLRLGVAGWAR